MNQRNRSDLEISRSNSALTSSNSRIESKTYRLCLPNLVKKWQLRYIPKHCESFTSRSVEVTSRYRTVHLGVIVSLVCKDFFFCQARVSAAVLLIVKGWLKWVRREIWSHNGRFLVSKKLKFFIGIPNVNWVTD